MVESFSSGYFLTQLRVAPFSGDRAVLRNDWYDQYQTKYSWTNPLVMKVGTTHLPVYSESAVPAGVLGVPKQVFEKLNVEQMELTDVLLAKSETVDQLLSMNLLTTDEA